jgi:hypothetical protein
MLPSCIQEMLGSYLGQDTDLNVVLVVLIFTEECRDSF